MMAIITALEFPRDLQGAEASMTRWKEHRAEVDSRKDAVNSFLQTGQAMIDDKHFLSDEVRVLLLLLDFHKHKHAVLLYFLSAIIYLLS